MTELFEARAFTLGMVALLNPCGFALLPAYLGFFISTDDPQEGESRLLALNRAQLVGLSLTLGFLTVFGLIGLVLVGSIGTIGPWLPHVTVVMGIGLVALGVAMLLGFEPMMKMPKMNAGGQNRSFLSMYLFGVSYAVASLSCTIGIFLSAVPTSTSGASFGSRMGSFFSYGVGMGLLATVVTLAVALGRSGVITAMKRLLPRINQISAFILVVVGVYITLYGIWSVQVLSDATSVTGWIDAVVIAAENIQTSLSNGLGSRAAALGQLFVGVNIAILAAGLFQRRRSVLA